MQCPYCHDKDLDLERAIRSTRVSGLNHHNVSAPCCGAPLRVMTRVQVNCEVEVNDHPESRFDDWGVAFKIQHC